MSTRAHPRKRNPGTKFTNEDISGASAIGNLADTVMSIEKPNIQVTKNRDFNIKGYVRCNFNPVNRRIYQASIGDTMVYSWDHNGVALPEHPASELNDADFAIQYGADPFAEENNHVAF